MMNEDLYTMDFDERKDYVRDKISEVLENDTDAFVEVCEELDSWNGFLNDARCFDMWDIDSFFNKPSELIDKMDDFDPTDEYFYYTSYGNVTTSSDRYDVYSDEVDVDDIIDAIESDYNHISISKNTSLDELCSILYNEDFGIERDLDDYDEDEEPEETDEEFMKRIDEI